MKLKVQKRAATDKKNKNIIWGIVYGGIEENILISCSLRDFEKAYSEVGSSGVLELDIEGELHDVIIKDTQLDNISGEYYHVDFYAITKGQEMEASVNFEFTGESQAEKFGGLLNTSLTEIQIKALPKDLPKSIEIDLAELKNIGDTIKLIDVKLPDGVKFIDGFDLESSIVSVVAAKSVADEEEANSQEVEITSEENIEKEDENKDGDI